LIWTSDNLFSDLRDMHPLEYGLTGMSGKDATSLRTPAMSTDDITTVLARLDRIEATLKTLVERQVVKDWYTTEEIAALVGKSEYTVREWCRQGRIRAQKKGSGRGKYQSWVVGHEELERFQKEGLLPLCPPA
jgi:excisionase family DNA binding protein